MRGTFRFYITRSGDGKRFFIGKGTLAQGARIVRKMDKDFEAGKKVHHAYEGCDISAEQGGNELYSFVDGWERNEYGWEAQAKEVAARKASK